MSLRSLLSLSFLSLSLSSSRFLWHHNSSTHRHPRMDRSSTKPSLTFFFSSRTALTIRCSCCSSPDSSLCRHTLPSSAPSHASSIIVFILILFDCSSWPFVIRKANCTSSSPCVGQHPRFCSFLGGWWSVVVISSSQKGTQNRERMYVATDWWRDDGWMMDCLSISSRTPIFLSISPFLPLLFRVF